MSRRALLLALGSFCLALVGCGKSETHEKTEKQLPKDRLPPKQ